MPTLADRTRCTGCGACAYKCPVGALSMTRDAEGFLYPVLTGGCIECGACGAVCPVLAPVEPPAYEVLAAVNNDLDVRQKSSSGGVFWALASVVLGGGGCVAGAAFNAQNELVHVMCLDEAKAAKLRSSKYLQSDMGPIYRQIELGGRVLFSGTPCQTAAVRRAFANSKQLLTVAVACHGAPSPLVFKSYLSALERRYISSAEVIDFKDKSTGWRTPSLRIAFENGQVYKERAADTPYMRAFIENLSVRPSCQDCVCKRGLHSDLMLADFWGVEKHCPDLDDDRGVSLVLIGTEAGRAAFEGVGDLFTSRGVALEQAVEYNPYVLGDGPPNPLRADFIKATIEGDFFEAADRFLKKPSAKDRLLSKLKRMLR